MGGAFHEPSARLGPASDNPVSIVIIIAVLIAVALYNATELLALILINFNNHHGIYFWSLLLSTAAGVIPLSLGCMIDYFELAPLWLILIVISVGWIFMVGGQSVVLYSRLHLVSRNDRALCSLRYLISVNTTALVVPTTVLYFGTAYMGSGEWSRAYGIMEIIQIIGICAQECIISGLYIVETIKLIRLYPNQDKARIWIIYQLLVLNLAAIMMDVLLLVLQFQNMYSVQVVLKATVYSIKLKLEFAVLGRLVLYCDRPPL
ncbi:hypothetical protein FQN54_000368 [Arachnomyces sp. PD_36]|nr:hypothetical protein FQN54_000368 [Arachnomyces sp. PD_36]